MNVEYLIQLLGNRLTALNTSKEQAFLTGDLERINVLDIEINGVLDTLNKLKLLEGISQTALATPFTEAEVVQNGIEASFGINNSNIIFNGDPTGILLGYDISSYATDPLHEQKIKDILNYIAEMDSPEKIDAYINNEAIGSPVTGAMVYNSAQKYNIDSRLLMALMELDSRFGTVGLAIRTLNPGNVGNDDAGNTQIFNSWQEGVDAVAKWLDNHKVNDFIIEEEEISEEEIEPISETIETTTEIDENGDEITTTTTTTITEEIIPDVGDTDTIIPVVDEPVIIPELPVEAETIITPTIDEVVSKLKGKKKIV